MLTDLQISEMLATKHVVALRAAFFREPFPHSLAVAHINRVNSSTRGTTISTSESRGEKSCN